MTRVAITTDRFESAAHPFRRYGFEAIPLPCIRIDSAEAEVLVEARTAAATCSLLLLTSARTVELLWPHGSMPTVEVATVGARTADAVVARGGTVILSGNAGFAQLIDQLDDRLESATVVFPHGGGPWQMESSASHRNAFATLRGRAADLAEFEIYRTIPQPPGNGAVEAAAFTSPSAVEGWRSARPFDGLVIGVIGSTTRLALAAHRPPDVVAPSPSHDALAQAMASYLEVSR